MKRLARPLVSVAAGCAAVGVALGACGARSGLDSPLKRVDSGAFAFDAGTDGDDEASFDATVDSGFDATLDSGFDAGFDAFFPVDVIAPIDAHVSADSSIICPEGGLPTAYLLDAVGGLYTFDPATLATNFLGIPDCGAGALSAPWTLSVSRDGSGYIVGQTPWAIYKVDLASPLLTCARTPFVNGQLGLQADYSIAVSRTAGVEKLFFYGEPGLNGDGGRYPNTPPILAESDLTSFVLTKVAGVLPMPPGNSYPLDMQGDPLGHLFGYSDDGLLIEIDSTTGAAIGQAQTNFPGSSDWAVMSYENQIYLFAYDGSGSSVARYDIGTQTLTTLGGVSVAVVGASAVPCFRAGPAPPLP